MNANREIFGRGTAAGPPSHEGGYRGLRSRRTSAFTLFEVIIAMSIFSLLAGTVFAIVWKAADSAAQIREFDTRDEQVSRFLGLMRRTIESLPQDGTIQMAPPEETGGEFYEMTISGAATAFHFGELPSPTGDTIIGLRPMPEDIDRGELSDVEATLYQVAISREDFGIKDADGDGMVFQAGDEDAFLEVDEEGRYWMPLLDFVTGMGWRFWDEEQRDWLDLWEDDTRMPKMLELSLSDPYRPAPIRVVFDLPDHLTQAQEESSTASDTDTTTTTDTNADSSARRPQPGADGDTGRQPEGGGDRGRRGGGKGSRRGDGEGREGGPPGRPPGGGRPESGRGGRPGGGPPGNPGGGAGGGRPAGPPSGGGGAPTSTSR